MFRFLILAAVIIPSSVFSQYGPGAPVQDATTQSTKICTPGACRPLAHSCDKTKYEKCADDGCKWNVEKCPAYYVFGNGECRPLKTTVKPEVSTTPASGTSDSGRCTESAGPDGWKPDPTDCTKYFQCVHGYWLQRPCGPGTAWDQANLTCNYYDLVCKK